MMLLMVTAAEPVFLTVDEITFVVPWVTVPKDCAAGVSVMFDVEAVAVPLRDSVWVPMTVFDVTVMAAVRDPVAVGV